MKQEDKTNKNVEELAEALSISGLVPQAKFEQLTKGMPAADVVDAFDRAKKLLTAKAKANRTSPDHLLGNLARQRVTYRSTK